MRDLLSFIFKRKKFILIPLFLAALIFGILVALLQSPAVTPFIYTIF